MLLPKNEMKSCAICGDTGIIRVDDLNSERCKCNVTRRLRDLLGPEIAPAKIIQSPLYEPGKDWDHPKSDRTRENLFIRGKWDDVIVRHLKWTFIAKLCKDLSFRFLIITDERIKNVFVGNESAKAKNKEDRDRTKSFNGLPDVMCDHDLVLIRLGFLGHKNVAAPGALKEALMIREVANLPTWIIDHYEDPFEFGHRTYSDEVSSYISTHFQVVDLRTQEEVAAQPKQEDRVPTPSMDDLVEDVIPADKFEFDTIVSDGPRRKPNKKFRKTGGGPV